MTIDPVWNRARYRARKAAQQFSEDTTAEYGEIPTVNLSVDTVLERAAAYEREQVQAAYYLEPDEGEEFCLKCAERERLARKTRRIVRSDQSATYDYPPDCARCDTYLAGWLTDYGATELLASLENQPFDPEDGGDCYLWSLVENNYAEDSEEYQRLLRLLERGDGK